MTPTPARVGELIEALVPVLSELLESRENWTLTLHGGRGGDVRCEVRTVAEILSRQPPVRPLEEKR